MEIRINAIGLPCPKPVIETKKALASIKEGNIIAIVDNEIARENISKLAKSMNLHYCISESNGTYEISIFKGAYAESPEDMVSKRPSLSNITIVITSEFLGKGDDVLGDVLMKGYLYSLTEYEPYPKAILLMNSAVKLSTVNEATLKSLKTLEDLGTEVLSCGTCLDFFQLGGLLRVGEVTNMYSIVERMTDAANTIVIG